MTQWNYRYAGLRIVSELRVPEWTVFEQPEPLDEADVRITLDEAQITHAGITADEFYFHIPEAGAYRVLRGREIVITPALDAGARELRLFLLGSAWGALCYQRGILALHTSVVQVGEFAMAFCGATGAGKSSVAAKLGERGYPLIGDDLCCFDFDGDAPRVYPSAPRLKLWRDALANLGWREDSLERDHFRLDKFHVIDLPDTRRGKPESTVLLRAIYLLEWGAPGITRLTGMNALRRLVAVATYRGELLEPMGQVAAHWQRCAELAQRVPVYQFARMRDWAAMNDALDLLVESWQNP